MGIGNPVLQAPVPSIWRPLPLTKVDLIEGLIYVDFGTFDDWNSFKPKVELWNEYKSNWIGDFDCVSTIFEDNGTLERIQLCLENLDQRE